MNVCVKEKGSIYFTKLSGHGNDFIIVDNSFGRGPLDWNRCASAWCSSHVSIGADGLLVIEPSDVADFTLRIFNSDGSEAEMCGNGVRCAAIFVAKRKMTGASMTFETMAGIVRTYVTGNTAYVQLPDPTKVNGEVRVNTGDLDLMLYTIDTGVPHAVVFKDYVAEISSHDIDSIGKAIRYHTAFEPQGTNVDFVEVMGPDIIRVRTYERGVEKETMACGTGAVASAVISHMYKDVGQAPIYVQMPGGVLTVDFTKDALSFKDVWLSGEVQWIYDGEFVGEI